MQTLRSLSLALVTGTLLGLAGGCATHSSGPSPSSAQRCYELRVYTINPGKDEALHNRFRHHTLRLFKKHGIESVGYWMPLDTNDHRLHFILRYPNREAREKSWQAFLNDPDWKAAYQASEAAGPILARPPENQFLTLTDYSPAVAIGRGPGPRVFELRTYLTPPGLLPNLDARFRDHTVKLFARHGMGNFAYWHKDADQPDAAITLQYLLTHASREAAAASFKNFGADPEWKTARAESEKKAGGSLTAPGGVKSVFLAPTDYSPTR